MPDAPGSSLDKTYSKSYAFGVGASDAPTITGIAQVNSAELKFEPEVYVTAQNGEGAVTALARTSVKSTGTFTGYTTTGNVTANTFAFGGYTYFIKSIGKTRRKGEFMEVSVEVEGYPTANVS